MRVVNFKFGARQHLSATWVQSWDSAHRADVPIMLPWQPHMSSLKWLPLRGIANLTCFENFWHMEKSVGTIDVRYVTI